MRAPIFVLLPSECLGGKIEKHTKNSKIMLNFACLKKVFAEERKETKKRTIEKTLTRGRQCL